MANCNFLTRHLIKKITDMVKLTEKDYIQRYIYLDRVIYDGNRVINRVNRYNPYEVESLLPTSWYMLSVQSLLSIYEQLSDNKIYTYDVVDGGAVKKRL